MILMKSAYEFLNKPFIFNLSVVKIFFFLTLGVAILGAPLFTIIAAIAILNFYQSGSNIIVVAQEFSSIADKPLFFMIPIFTLAGYLLASSNASKRLVRLTKAALGWMPGGLAIVTLLTCAIFTAFTGASGVTIVALGGFLLPALLSEKYEEKFSLGLVTASGSLGLLFPPSLAIIIFGVVAEVSIDDLFIAGALPGIFLIVVLSVFSMFYSSRFKIEKTPFSFKVLLESLWQMKWEIPLPILLFSGIYSGKLAISDAASFTVVYIFIVEVLILKDIKIRELPKIIKESMVLVGAIIIILGSSLAATNYIIDQQVPQKIFIAIQGVITNKWVFLIVLNLFLLVVGCIMDIFSALVVVVPLILPIAQAYNINIIHLGVIFLANLEIGYLTPPVGMNLFIASIRFNQSIIKLYRASLVFIGILFASLIVITYVPQLSIWFIDKPSLVGQWEYTDQDGQVEQYTILGNGKLIHKKGSLLELMMQSGQTVPYTIKGNKIMIQAAEGERRLRFELFDNGELLKLDDLDQKADQAEADVPAAEPDFLFEDDPLMQGERQALKFYKNKINPPLTVEEGRFIADWQDEENSLQFSFNNQLKWTFQGEEKLYLYKIEKSKLLLFDPEQPESDQVLDSFKFKLKKEQLILKNKKNQYQLKRIL